MMPTLSFHAPEKLARQVRAAARKRGLPVSRFLKIAAEKEIAPPRGGPGDWVKKYAGIVKGAPPDLSVREGYGD
jgi:hypothetical protein